ncbi:response regulator [Pseudooceanicola sp. C21-150M6]|uniref:response regulator n=1 Tax=Pseudooceanicola sp. C21-150M6 TaxID=3434355 RepID=UPI003D7FADB9
MDELTEQALEPGGALNVLILDDNELDRLRLSRLCQKAGLLFDATEVGSVAEMRTALDRGIYELIFIDHNLGMETGLDALRLITSHENQVDAIPIMVTSVTNHEIAVQAMREGCFDYLVKEELSVDSLRKSVSTAIEKHLLIRALGDARSFKNSVMLAVKRFSRSCGPEMRGILAKTIRQIRMSKMSGTLDEQLLPNLTTLEVGARDIIEFLDHLNLIIENRDVPAIGGTPIKPRLN